MNNTHTQREIRFRAWDKDKKQWVYARLEDPGWCIVDNMFDAGELSYWQQYTGLKDKNGKEIYEGDIVKHMNNNWSLYKDAIYKNYPVMWHHHEFVAVLNPEYKNETGETCMLCMDNDFERFWESEVIGNIYENPEMLNKNI